MKEVTSISEDWKNELNRQRQMAMEYRFELSEIKCKSLFQIIVWWFQFPDRKKQREIHSKYLELNKQSHG